MAHEVSDTNRKRTNRVIFYLSDEELNLVKEKINKSKHTTMSSYIRDSILNGVIVVRNYDHFRKIVHEINKIGTNINQAVKLANTEGKIYKTEINNLQTHMEEVWKILSKSIK